MRSHRNTFRIQKYLLRKKDGCHFGVHLFFFMSTANKVVMKCHRCHRKNIVCALEEIFHRQIAHTYFYFTNQSIYKNCDTPITTPSTTAVEAGLGCHKMVSQFCDTSKKISVDWLCEPM